MRSLDISNYSVIGKDGKEHAFHVKDILLDVMFHPELKLKAIEVLKCNKLAEKIEAAGDEILLEEADYAKIKSAVETLSGFTREYTEFIGRIMDAPEVDVKQA